MKRKRHIADDGLAQRLKKMFSEKELSKGDRYVNKIYDGTDDNFFEATNTNLRVLLKLDQKNESYEKDLKRFGTRIKLIDVADDAIPNKRIEKILPLKKPAKAKRFKEKYEKDLERFGTHQGIINVSNDDERKKKKLKPFPTDFSKALYSNLMKKWKVRDTTPYSANPFSDIYREFPKLQVTIQNKSTEEKEVFLWGANQEISMNPPEPGDVQDHSITAQISVPGGVHPQGIVVNPANQMVYIANQLSGTVTVLDTANQVVKVIQLQPSFPGFSSPVALTVNSKSSSSKYGYVYVACSVSNKIAVIDLSLNVVANIQAGVRPIALAFNPVNRFIYVANLVSDTVSVIHAETFEDVTGSPLPSGQDPIGVGVNPVNGDVYIANSLGNTISVYSSSNLLLTIIDAGIYPVSITYNPANNSMYAVAANSNVVYQIETVTHSIVSTITTGGKPYNSFFDSYNNYLYVQNRIDNTFTIIRPDNSKIDGLSFGKQNIGGTFSGFNNSIYISDTSNNAINVIGYLQVRSSLSIDPDYAMAREEFKSSPAIIQHTKFVVTGPERLNSFRLSNFTPTGNIRSKPISFELYASPQSKLNVAEVTELAGTVINNKMNWRFKLPGLHTVSILIWYRQFEVMDIFNNNYK